MAAPFLLNAGNPKTRLLRNSERPAGRFGGRDPQGIPKARPQIPPRSQPRRQIGGRPLQERAGSLRHPERQEEAGHVRSGRLLLRERLPGRGPRQRCQAASQHGFRRLRFFGDVPWSAGRKRSAAARKRGRSRYERRFFQRHLQPVFSWRGDRSFRRAGAPERRRSRIRTEHRVLAGHPRHPGED